MKSDTRIPRPAPLAAVTLLAGLAVPALGAAATRSVDEHRAADPQGQVEIINVAGRVEVAGWDKPEVAVSGAIGSDVDRVEVTTAGTRTTVRVVTHAAHGLHLGYSSPGPEEAQLAIHVPQRSSLTTSLVSSDLKIAGVAGNQEIQTVSGDVDTAAQHDVRVRTVSGDLRLSAGPDTRLLDLSTVSGDLQVTGGAGDVTVNTVSGDGILKLGTLNRARFKTVSGDLAITADVAGDGRFEAESVSGDFVITFTGAVPAAEYDLQSFSGDLTTCFGQKAVKEGYGPGSRLSFREGAGTARIRVDTKSGDVNLCTRK